MLTSRNVSNRASWTMSSKRNRDEPVQPTVVPETQPKKKEKRQTRNSESDVAQPEVQLTEAEPRKRKTTRKGFSRGKQIPKESTQPKKKRQVKVMNKKTRKSLQDSIKSINVSTLITEGTTALTEEYSESHLAAFADSVCESKQFLTEIVEYLCNTFATLHFECKQEKNSQMQFQLKWYSYCSALLLEEKHTLSAINLEEAKHPVLSSLRQEWLEFCREQAISVCERNSVMTTLSSAVYNSLLEHVASFQESQSGTANISCNVPVEEDGVYYRFGGGTLCEMLHRRYKQIGSASNKNLMSIEITLLQAINTKDKSDIPNYLQYRDRGFMYIPHKVFIPFLQKVDQHVKKVTNVSSLNEHGDNLVKVVNDYSCYLL